MHENTTNSYEDLDTQPIDISLILSQKRFRNAKV